MGPDDPPARPRWPALVAFVAIGIALAHASAPVPTDPGTTCRAAMAFPEATWSATGLSRWGSWPPDHPVRRGCGVLDGHVHVVPVISTGVLPLSSISGHAIHVEVDGGAGGGVRAGRTVGLRQPDRGYADLTATMLIGWPCSLRPRCGQCRWGRDRPELGVAILPLLVAAVRDRVELRGRETAIFAWPVIGWMLGGSADRCGRWRGSRRRPWRGWSWSWPCAGGVRRSARGVLDDLGADIAQSEVSSDAVYVGQSWWWYAASSGRCGRSPADHPYGLPGDRRSSAGSCSEPSLAGSVAWGLLALGLLWVQGGPWTRHPTLRLDVERYWLSFIVPLMLAAVGTMVIVVRSSRRAWRVRRCRSAGVRPAGCWYRPRGSPRSYPGSRQRRRRHGRAACPPRLGRVVSWPTRGSGPTGVPSGASRVPDRPVRRPTLEAGRRSLDRLVVPADLGCRVSPARGDVVIYSAEDRTCWHCRERCSR